MNGEKNILDKLNILYKKRIENKIHKIRNKNVVLKEEIEKLKDITHSKKVRVERLEEDIKRTNEEYERVREVFYKRGINFTAINKSHNLKEWDNLIFNRKGDLWIIATKDGDEIKVLDEKISYLLEEILRGKNYSLVITRIEDKFIKIKLHLV